MTCPFCKKEIKDNAQFCPFCGNKIPDSTVHIRASTNVNDSQRVRYCKNCGKPCSPGQVFCPDCINSLSAGEERNNKKRKSFPIFPLIILMILLLAGGLLGLSFATGLLSVPGFSGVKGNNDNQDTHPELSTTDEEDLEGDQSNSVEIAVIGDSSDKKTSEQRHRYEVISADISWINANRAAKEAGGHLATITSADEYTEICRIASESGLKYLWIGAYLTSTDMNWGDKGTWVTGESWDYEKWYPGEPSIEDTDGTKENYLCIWNVLYDERDIGWTFNDQRNDIVKDFPECAGKVGYIIEYGDGFSS